MTKLSVLLWVILWHISEDLIILLKERVSSPQGD